jgi:hypothetical protein
MSTREFYLKTFRAERPAFVNVIRALPGDQLGYKPHERNSSAGDIAWFLALELRSLVDMIETGEVHWQQPPNPNAVEASPRRSPRPPGTSCTTPSTTGASSPPTSAPWAARFPRSTGPRRTPRAEPRAA